MEPELRGTVPPTSDTPPTCLEMIERNVKDFPNKMALNWIDKSGGVVQSLSYADFWTRVESIAWHIRNKWEPRKET